MANLNFAIKLGLMADGLKSGLNSAKSALSGFASSVKSAMGMIAGAFAAGQLKAFGQECLNLYKAQATAETKLSTVMKQRMNATDAEVKSILELTSAQQKLGVIGDEVQIAGAQQVSTFLKQKDSLNQLIPAMNNLLAQQKGLDASQGDAVSIANLMGKAMMGQTSALKRVGISFDEAQEKVMKYGTESQKAAMLAQIIKDNVGDMNSELAKTDLGKIQQMNNILGDTKEQIGAAIAPIVSELAPKIANMATNMASIVTKAIDIIKNNLATLGEFIVSIFAAVKLGPIFGQWLAEAQSATARATALAEASAVRRQQIEQQVVNVKRQLAVQEAALEEATGAKKVAIATKVEVLKEKLAQKETAYKAAMLAEQKAQETAAAAAHTTIWSVAWNSVKTAGVMCWTTIKAAMVSTGIGAIIVAATFALQKLVEWFVKLDKVQRCWNTICDGCGRAFDLMSNLYDKTVEWYNSLGWVAKFAVKMLAPFVSLAESIGWIVDKLASLSPNYSAIGKTVALGLGKKDKKEQTETSVDLGSGKGLGGRTTHTQTPAQKAADDVANAEKEYAKSIKKAQTTADLSTDKQKATIKAQEEALSAMQSLYGTYADAYAVTGNNGYLSKMKGLIAKIETLTEATDAAKNTMEEAAKEADDRANALANFRKTQAKLANNKSIRDTTFDYKLSKDEKMTVDLEFELEHAKAQLDELKQYAESGCKEAIDAINDAQNNVTDITTKLNLEKVKQDVQSLQKELAKGWQDFGTEAWQAVKGTVDGINSMIETMNDPDASGWEKFCSVIDTLINLFQTVQGVMTTVNTIMELSTTLKKANAAASQQEALASGSAAMAKAGETTANATASGAKLPFPANIAAIAAGVAAGLSVVSTIISILGSFKDGGFVNAYASGGFIQGAYTSGDRNLIGVARVNAGEAILNPSQQRNFMRIANGQGIASGTAGGGKVKFEIEGRKLVGVLSNETTRSGKIR